MKLHTAICLVLISIIFYISSCSTDNSGNQKENLEMKPIKTDSNMQSEGKLNSNIIESKESESKEEQLYYIPKEVKLEKLDSLVFDIADSGEYKFIYTLKDKDSTYLGDLYARSITEEVYSSFYISKISNGQIDTLYIIDKTTFIGIDGIDLKLSPKDFYGYSFNEKYKFFFSIYRLDNGGENISDEITIEWNKNKNRFAYSPML